MLLHSMKSVAGAVSPNVLRKISRNSNPPSDPDSAHSSPRRVGKGQKRSTESTLSTSPFSEKLIHRMRETAAGIEAMTLTTTTSSSAPDLAAEKLNWTPSAYEHELVKRSWSDDFDGLYQLGSDIYEYIFDHEPDAKALFLSMDAYGAKWKDSAAFRSQALRFVQVITQAVKNLKCLENLNSMLYKLGAKHRDFDSKGFKDEYWFVFADAMQHAIGLRLAATGDAWSAEDRGNALRVWKLLADYLVHRMLSGYLEAAGAAAKATTD